MALGTASSPIPVRLRPVSSLDSLLSAKSYCKDANAPPDQGIPGRRHPTSLLNEKRDKGKEYLIVRTATSPSCRERDANIEKV